MSSIKIILFRKLNGWTELRVDNKFIGTLEDVEGEVRSTIQGLIDMLPIENTELIVINEEYKK